MGEVENVQLSLEDQHGWMELHWRWQNWRKQQQDWQRRGWRAALPPYLLQSQLRDNNTLFEKYTFGKIHFRLVIANSVSRILALSSHFVIRASWIREGWRLQN